MLYWVIGVGSAGSLLNGTVRIWNSRSTRTLRYAQAAESWSKVKMDAIRVAGMKAEQEEATVKTRLDLMQRLKDLLTSD